MVHTLRSTLESPIGQTSNPYHKACTDRHSYISKSWWNDRMGIFAQSRECI